MEWCQKNETRQQQKACCSCDRAHRHARVIEPQAGDASAVGGRVCQARRCKRRTQVKALQCAVLAAGCQQPMRGAHARHIQPRRV
jgi:hypothetical protein